MLIITHTFTTIQMFVQILYGGFILLLLLFGWDLLNRYIKADKRTRKDAAYRIFFIIAIALIGYGFYTLPAMVRDFFIDDFTNQGYDMIWVYPIGFFLILLMITPIGYVCLLIVFKKKKIIAHSLGILGAIAVIYMFIFTIMVSINPINFSMEDVSIDSQYMIPIGVMYVIFGIIDFFGIVYILVVKLAPQKEVRRQVLLGIVGIVIAGIGGYLELTKKNPNNWWYVIGVLIELFGFIVMRHFFLSIPSYDEFAWKSGMLELHVIIAETGISLFYKSFANLNKEDLHGNIKVTATIPESEARPNTDLVAGGLVGIKGMLSEISGDKGKLENIQIGEKSLVFKQGKTVLCLLLADENLGVYHSLLDDLVQRIEVSHPDLDNFNGDTRKIHIAPIVKEVFDLKEK